jgi:hypothetical protein
MIRGALGPPMALLVILWTTPPLAAQDASDSAAYRALTQTPVAAFSPTLGAAIMGHRGQGVALYARYGLMSFRSNDYIHNFGAGLDLPLAQGRLGLTVGHYGPTCPRDDCPGHLTVSVDGSQPLTGVALGREDNAATLAVGLDVSAGYARPSSTSLVSGAALVTFALVPNRPGVRLLPFVAPGVGVGLTHEDDDTDAGMLPMLTMGVGLLGFTDRLGISAGASRVFLRGGNWVVGLNVGWALQ